jgi:hypothetical protein
LADPEPTEGLNKDFNFMINKPFFLVSKMYMNRVAERTGNNVRLRTLARKNTAQHWFFDGASKTIKSKQDKNVSWTISSDGTGKDLGTSKTTARWF